jgi:hypothetical protein
LCGQHQQLVCLGGIQHDGLGPLVVVPGHTVDIDLHPSVLHVGGFVLNEFVGTFSSPGTLVVSRPCMYDGGGLELVLDEP